MVGPLIALQKHYGFSIKTGYGAWWKLMLNQGDKKFDKQASWLEVSEIGTDLSGVSKQCIPNTLKLDKVLRLAKQKTKEGRLEEAKLIYQDILAKFPKNKRAQQSLVALNKPESSFVTQNPYKENTDQLISLYNQGKLLAVIELAELLTQQYPKAFDVWNLLGAAYKGLGRTLEASKAFKKVTELNPTYAEAYNNMGVVLRQQGELEAALEAYRKALSLKPDFAEVYYNMGNLLNVQGKLDDAIDAYTQVILLKPDFAEAHSNMGIILKEKGNLEEAKAAYNKAISIKPDYAVAYYNMGNLLRDQSMLREALKFYKRALYLKPDYALAHNNIGVVLREIGNLEAAVDSYKKAIEIMPKFAEAHNNLGVALNEKGDLEEGLESYNLALALNPNYAEAHENLSYALLKKGMLGQGFDEYEWRWKTPKGLRRKRNFIKPLWDGKASLQNKRILLWSEQGIGDTINWSSQIPSVESKAKGCILQCNEKLHPLLSRSFPNIKIEREDRKFDNTRGDIDYHLPMGSLYRQSLSENFIKTNSDAFLIPDPKRIKFWKDRLKSLGNGPYIGIAWKSSVMTSNRLPNYAPLIDWSPLLRLLNVKFINLQYKDFEGDLNWIKNEFGVKVHNFKDLDLYNNIAEVAALSAALDFVVSTICTVPLISAGVGTKTKLANWRQSAWNSILHHPVGPSVDIFERNTWDSWENVFRAISEDICKLE